MDSQTAYRELEQARKTATPASTFYKQSQEELGVNASRQRSQDLRSVIRNTEQALRGVEASVSGRTQGSLVTEAQRSRLANLERAPIAQQFTEQQGALSDEQATYRDLLSEAGTRAGLEYTTQADRLKGLESNYSLAVAQEQAAEQRRQFEAQLALERDKARKQSGNTYDIQSVIDALMGRNQPVPQQVPTGGVGTIIPKITIDKSRGLNLTKAMQSGAFSGSLGGLRF